MTTYPIQQTSTQANANSLYTGNAINTVHKVIQIQQPDQIEQRKNIPGPAQIQRKPGYLDGREPPSPE